jgi:hypothetical protein
MGKSWGETNLCVYATKTPLNPVGKNLEKMIWHYCLIKYLYEKTFGKEKLINKSWE